MECNTVEGIGGNRANCAMAGGRGSTQNPKGPIWLVFFTRIITHELIFVVPLHGEFAWFCTRILMFLGDHSTP